MKETKTNRGKTAVIVGIVAVLVVGLVVLVSVLTKLKESVTKDTFAEIMTDEGFEVVDQSSMIAEGSDFSVVYLAQPKNLKAEDVESTDESGLFSGQYQVEFYQFDDADKCEANYDTLDDELVAAYKNAKGYSTTEKNLSNFSKRTVKTDDRYYVISRVNDTLVIAISPIDEAKTIDDVLKKLGYN